MSKEDSEKTLKQIFRLLQTNLQAYMKSSDLQAEKIVNFRKHRVRRSRQFKSSSCPAETTDVPGHTKGTYSELPTDHSGVSLLCSKCKGMISPLSSIEQQGNNASFERNGQILTKSSPKLPRLSCAEMTDEIPVEDEKSSVAAVASSSSSEIEHTDSILHENSIVVEQNLSVIKENIDLKIKLHEASKLQKLCSLFQD